jgi:hypothetical protein
MKEFILIWRINDYPDNGGGLEFDLFDSIQQIEDKVNELNDDERFAIEYSARIADELKFIPVEKVTRWKVES